MVDKRRRKKDGWGLTPQSIVVAGCLLICGAYVMWPREISAAPSADTIPADAIQPSAMTFETLPDACTYTNFTSDPLGHQQHLRRLLKHILSFGPRVGGSSSWGYFGVMRALVSMMQCNKDDDGPAWHVAYDNFTSDTPLGMRQFTNLLSSIENPYFVNGDTDVADKSKRRRFPKALGRRRLDHLVLAAHWDSKMMTGPRSFLGACDSVVPMLIVLELMKMVAFTLRAASTSEYHAAIARNSLPAKVTVIFFDGEEAFVDWKGTDHTYGSRHLATEWAQTGHINSIDLFVLFDLMGPAGLTYHNMFPADSGAFYESMYNAEQRLRRRGRLLTTSPSFPWEPNGFPNRIEDDHIHWVPYVPVLHLIAVPFPQVWHTPADDEAAIDYSKTIDLLHIAAHGLMSLPL